MIIPKSKSRLITVLIHILIWGVFGLIYFFQPLTYNITVPYQLWIKQSILLGLLVLAYYSNSFILVPRFLLKNKTSIYFIIVIVIAAVIVLINIYADEWLNIHQLMDAAFHKSGPPKHHKGRDHGWDLAIIAITALVLGVSTSITAVQKWQKDKQEREELEKDKVTSELSFLKAQINPHFFFNTLNNIYALTQVDAEVAGKAIHQLSRMMRYLLYDTQQGHTMLSQELAFVKDYISLMRLRLTEVVKINFDEPTDLKDKPLAPMIFLPFVENAFKHGVSATQQSHIDIVVLQKDNLLDLTVKNSIINDNSISLDTNSGIGLVNTRRRLDLLYPGKYKLEINELNTNNEYTVHLILDLS
ncbi:MAG TPA: histidine kinase [Mucilaginibacter sp.]|jgi:two-component system LytT family sensor kinase|nr:histidine kinase [Mucilaginibacter sp.]